MKRETIFMIIGGIFLLLVAIEGLFLLKDLKEEKKVILKPLLQKQKNVKRALLVI